MRRAPVALAVAVLGAALALPGVAGARSALPSGRSSYRTLADYDAELAALARAHPGLVHRVVLPERTVQGREIVGVEIAADVAATDDGRPTYVVVGDTHAREWSSGEVAMEYALDLVRHAATPRIARLLAGERTLVVPVANPDGFEVSRGDSASHAGPDPLHRTNCRAVGSDPPDAPCSERGGVDLNRDYGAFWGGAGASVRPGQPTYRGTGPWSEPEAAAVHEELQRLQVTGVVSLHSVAALVLRQPGFRALGTTPDEARMAALGDAMGRAAGYRSEPGDELYDATGALEDWDYAAQGAFGYTIELGGQEGSGPVDFQGPFRRYVVDQYLGTAAAGTAGAGVREALLLAGEEALDVRDHAVLRGSAPAGAVLALRKAFTTESSPICGADPPSADEPCPLSGPAFGTPDALDTTLTVGPSGRFVWQAGPSTRPFVARAGGKEAWTLTCEQPAGTVVASHAIVVGRGQLATVDPCVPGSAVRVAANVGRVGAVGAATPRLAASVTRTSRGTVLRRGVALRLRCSTACSVRVALALGSGAVGSRELSLRGGRTMGVRVRASSAGVRRLRRAAPGRRLGVVVSARAAGSAAAVVRRSVELG